MSLPPPVLQLALVVVAGVSAGYDIRFRRIPNWLVVAGLLVGLVFNIFLLGWAGLRSSLLGMALALLVYLPLYGLRGTGAGDAKLMAAIGAILGPYNWIAVFLLTALTGGAAALILVVVNGRARRTLENMALTLRELAFFRAPYRANPALDVSHANAVTLPHGAIIVAGSLEFLFAAGALTSWARQL